VVVPAADTEERGVGIQQGGGGLEI
jgi:hypothetical protein